MGTLKLVVGLGNPGKSYATTRHNLGYRVIEVLEKEKFNSAALFKPTGFMNASGGSVSERTHRSGMLPQEILVVCDDFSLPLGMLRLRLKGSSGGHNGLDSILQMLGTLEVPRLRMGIGPVPTGEDPADFVLKHFAPSDKTKVAQMIEQAVKAIQVIAEQGFESAMNQYNRSVA